MSVSISRPKKKFKIYSLQNPPTTTSSFCPSPTSTSPTSSCLTLGFWLSPDQTPVNNTGQVTPSRLAFILFSFSFLCTFCFFPHFFYSPILLRLHPVHSLSAQELQVIREIFHFEIIRDFTSYWWQKPQTATVKQRADFQCTAMQHSFPAPWLFSLSSVLCVCFVLFYPTCSRFLCLPSSWFSW